MGFSLLPQMFHTTTLIIALLHCFFYSFIIHSKVGGGDGGNIGGDDSCGGDGGDSGGERAEEERCVVCLKGLGKREKVRVMRNCGHVFHSHCIDRWIEIDHLRKTCPLCRTPLYASCCQSQSTCLVRPEPSWAVEQLLYLFGDDLLII